MAIRMVNGLPARIVQVLKDYLPAELDLIDTDEADGITTPDIPVGPVSGYFEWDRSLLPVFPAITMGNFRGRPLEMLSSGFGDRLHAIYEIDVKVHVQISAGSDDALLLQKLCFRYASGILRVLCDQKDGLQTSADPVRRVQRVTPRLLEWGPTEPQGTGQQTRTATVGIDVERVESRS